MAISSLPKMKGSEVKKKLSNISGETKTKTTLDKQLSSIYATLTNSSDLNPLIDLIGTLRENLLIKVATESNLPALRKGIQFLVRSLQALLNKDRIPLENVDKDGMVILIPNKHSKVNNEQVMRWLQDRWNDSVRLLCQLLHCHDGESRSIALQSLISLQRDASSALTRSVKRNLSLDETNLGRKGEAGAQWAASPWDAFMNALLTEKNYIEGNLQVDNRINQDVIAEFIEKNLQEYDDVRFAFCRKVSDFLQAKIELKEAVLLNTRKTAAEFLLGITAIPVKVEHLNTFLVPEMQEMIKKTGSGKSQKKGKKGQEKEDDEDDEEMDDWFSDSEDESGKAEPKKLKNGSSNKSDASGLGSAARAAVEDASHRHRLRRNPPFCLAVQNLTAQRAAFAKAWISVLLPTWKVDKSMIGGSLDETMKYEILVRMHVQIIPHLPKPSLLHDFLVDALDAGGATALLALNTLFTLITKHNLNYPAFYTRLYGLLLDDPPFLHVRFRSRFLRLLDTFLSSTHLSATLIASFAKRLSRAALRAPPSAIVVVLPFVWNLCKRHKRCLSLIHREFSEDRFDQGPAGIEDPFDALETDPLKTNAIDSSLWELAAMGSLLGASYQTTGGEVDGEGQAHYLASVSSLSRILAEPFTKERYGLEDFLDLTYTTMFETDVNKTLKRREGKKVVEPAVAFDLPRNANGKRALIFARIDMDDDEAQGDGKKKRVNLVEGEEEQDLPVVEQEDEEMHEARVAIQEARAKERSDVSNRIFSF